MAGSLPYELAQARLYYYYVGLVPYISFDIPTGDPTIIQPQTDLVVDFPVIIDATTQPLYVPGTVITLDGQDTLDYGFDVTAADVEIRGFVITHFVQAGIYLDTTGSDRVQANQIVDNQGYGIKINSPDNLVGGYYLGYDAQGVPQPNSVDGGNVIDTNQAGVFLTGSGATGNSIGGAVSDALAMGATGGNTISQNRQQGVLITNNANANLVQGNLIDSNGQTGTGYFGVEIDDSHDNSIGGAVVGGSIYGNQITNSGLAASTSSGGVLISDTTSNTFGNSVAGNYIGIQSDGLYGRRQQWARGGNP